MSGARAWLRRHDAGDQTRQGRVVAAVDGHTLERSGLDRFTDRSVAGLEQWRLAGHDDLFRHATGLEGEVHDRLLLDGNGDAAPHTLLESWKLCFDRVGARADRRENERTVRPSDRGEGDALTFVGDRDRGAGKHASRLVLHRAEDRAGINLGTRRGRQQHQYDERR